MNKPNHIKNIPQTIQNLIQDFLENYFSDCKTQEKEENEIEFYDLEFEEHEILESLLENLLKTLYLTSQTQDSKEYKFENDTQYLKIKNELDKNIEALLANFVKVSAEVCVEILAKSLVTSFQDIKLANNFILFELVRTFDNINVVKLFSGSDSTDLYAPNSPDGIYSILKPTNNRISSDNILKKFIEIRCNNDDYGEIYPISSYETEKLLRQMAMFEAKYNGKIESRVSSKEAKKSTLKLLSKIRYNYDFFTNVENVENPFHQPSKVYCNDLLYSGYEAVFFCAIGQNQLFFFEQSWSGFSE